MRLGTSVVVALVVAASVACDHVDTGGVTGPVRDATVTMPSNNTFFPGTVSVPVGGKVLWVGSGVTHNVIFFDANAPAGCNAWSIGDCLLTFPNAGTFGYVCSLHNNMDGIVTVQ